MKNFLLSVLTPTALLLGCFTASATEVDQGIQPMISGGPFTWVSYASVLYPPSRCATATESGQITLSICDGGKFQMWNHSQNQLGDEIRNVQSNLCLQGGDPSSPSVTVQQCNGGNAQRWVLTEDRLGWTMRNASNGYCLDTNGSIVLQNYCGLHDPSYQHWVKQ